MIFLARLHVLWAWRRRDGESVGVLGVGGLGARLARWRSRLRRRLRSCWGSCVCIRGHILKGRRLMLQVEWLHVRYPDERSEASEYGTSQHVLS